MNVNGEAIYGTRPWTKAAEGSTKSTAGAFTDNEESAYTAADIRFTTKGDILYAIALAWSDEVLIRSISPDQEVNHVSMLGSDEELSWSQTAEGLSVIFPKEKPSQYAHVFKLALK